MTQQRKPGAAFLLGALLSICILLLAANLWRINQPPRPDPRMVGLAVRATIFAIPTPTPRIVEVTRVVEVTAVPPTATATLTPTLTPQPPAGPGDGSEAQAAAAAPPDAAAPPASSGGDQAAPLVEVAAQEMAAAQDGVAGETALQLQAPAPAESLPPAPVEEPVEEPAPNFAADSLADTVQGTIADTTQGPCGGASEASFTTIPVDGGGLSHPDALHADLNLTLRGYSPAAAPADLVNKNGPVDADPPQLAGIFADFRRPPFGQAFRVNDWNWNCGERGCALGPLEHTEATLLTLAANPGESLGIPHRGAQVYGGGYKALVLYAEPTRITLGYTREDSVANGYAVHLENICVDANLLALYQSSNAAGRGVLPALREDEVLGTAADGAVLVAVRDRGAFLDPRSRLDWWQGF